MENSNSEFDDLYSKYSTESDYYSSDFSIDENESADSVRPKSNKSPKTSFENSFVESTRAERTNSGPRIKWTDKMCEVCFFFFIRNLYYSISRLLTF